MSFIPPPRGLGDEDDGPEMINASDQIKRVVDESCEIARETTSPQPTALSASRHIPLACCTRDLGHSQLATYILSEMYVGDLAMV